MQKSQKHALMVALVALAFTGSAHAQVYDVMYRVGDPMPAPITVQFTSWNFAGITDVQITLGASFPGQMTVSNAWLSASLSSSTVPTTLTISLNPAGLQVGSYSFNIDTADRVNGVVYTGESAFQFTVNLTVVGSTASVVASVVNAASFMMSAPSSAASSPASVSTVAPGEVISIFGYALYGYAVGPTAPLGLQLDSTGKVATELGGVQVFFNTSACASGISGCPTARYAAPLTYVSTTQINCVVPYEISTIINTTGNQVTVEVEYLGKVANSAVLQAALTSPGVFTATSTGTGQAAALNSDNTPNSASNPAPAGSIVQVWMTGEGQTRPAGVTGGLTCANGCATVSQIPKPTDPPFAAVGELTLEGLPSEDATITFYGEAPGLVSGVMQVNVVIPPDMPSGAAPLAIKVGSNWTQAGVTIAVK
jgi:uncharacterized protein (TIGR03437 family)